MKSIRYILAAAVFSGGLTACNTEHIIYEDKAYVMFPDTLFVCPATENGDPFKIQLASLQKCDYDRTYAVEINGKEGDAVYNWHYRLRSNTVVIPAGQSTGDLEIVPIYDNLPEDSDPFMEIRLLSQYGDEFSEEGSSTKVKFRKIKPFDIQDYTGACKVASMFLLQYRQVSSRDFRTSVVEGEENTILLEDFLSDGYDVKAKFDLSDPLNPRLNIVDEQIAGDCRDIFLQPHGDNMIRASDTPGYMNIVSPWTRQAEIFSLLRVNGAGTIGAFQNTLTWVEDYEVE